MNDFNEENGRSNQFLFACECISVSRMIRYPTVCTHLTNKGLTYLQHHNESPLYITIFTEIMLVSFTFLSLLKSLNHRPHWPTVAINIQTWTKVAKGKTLLTTRYSLNAFSEPCPSWTVELVQQKLTVNFTCSSIQN